MSHRLPWSEAAAEADAGRSDARGLGRRSAGRLLARVRARRRLTVEHSRPEAADEEAFRQPFQWHRLSDRRRRAVLGGGGRRGARARRVGRRDVDRAALVGAARADRSGRSIRLERGVRALAARLSGSGGHRPHGRRPARAVIDRRCSPAAYRHPGRRGAALCASSCTRSMSPRSLQGAGRRRELTSAARCDALILDSGIELSNRLTRASTVTSRLAGFSKSSSSKPTIASATASRRLQRRRILAGKGAGAHLRRRGAGIDDRGADVRDVSDFLRIA